MKLEKSLEQLNSMYQQAVNEKQVIKVDLMVGEKKLLRKDDKI